MKLVMNCQPSFVTLINTFPSESLTLCPSYLFANRSLGLVQTSFASVFLVILTV